MAIKMEKEFIITQMGVDMKVKYLEYNKCCMK